MSTAEITAYLAGADLANAHQSVTQFLTRPAAYRDAALGLDGEQAAKTLGGDLWAYWVRRGHDDRTAEMKAP